MPMHRVRALACSVLLVVLACFASVAPRLLGPARLQSAELGRPVPQATLRQALWIEPLGWAPLLASGAYISASGEEVLDPARIAAAIRRDPRALAPRLAAIALAARAQDAATLAHHLAILHRLDSATADRLAGQIAAAAIQSGEGESILSAFAADDALAAALLKALDQEGMDPATADRVLAALSPARLRAPGLRAGAVAVLVRQRAFARARRLWGGGGDAAGVYSPDFADLSAPPPFGWQMVASPAGVAERAPEGGVSVIGYGRSDGVLLAQLLTLPPGAHRLDARYASLRGAEGGLAVAVRCVDGPALARFALSASPGPHRDGAAVAVPAQGCAAQTLTVEAKALDGGGGQSARITGLSVAGAGA
ncbi:hypothetical protein TS85_15150 [Sphingomonas hengshuiensis]|uniref:Uncharacterized protein n=2 Tax=Sphingomonas hengshuiensis TaxID=1609977 RepID=A0A7U4J9R3_9SPHN|nr:hypothetical protein TS85_15150 [Sphingomonas hengshuiensis]